MGLDMELSAKIFVSKYGNDKSKALTKTIRKYFELDNEDYAPCYVETCVKYWRKANAIHGWFVKNVQKGEDDCGNYEVSRDQLVELAELCEKVLADPAVLGPELLPTMPGFFFGEYEYDEWYIEDLTSTVEGLKEVLGNKILLDEGAEFFYHSSW